MADKSYYMTIKKAVMARIKTLQLGISPYGDQVNLLITKKPFDPDRLPADTEIDPALYEGDLIKPMVQISQVGVETVRRTDGTTRAYISYPIQCTIINADNMDLFVNDDDYMDWREKIIQAFVGEQLPGAACVYTCTLEPSWVINTDAFIGKDLFVSAVALRFHTKQQVNTVTTDPIAMAG